MDRPENPAPTEIDPWIHVVDEASEDQLRDHLSNLSLSGTIELAAAFCFWNGSPRGFPPAHLVLQRLATLAHGGGAERATVLTVDRLLRLFQAAYSFGEPGTIHDAEYYQKPIDERLPETLGMRAAAQVITNPGSPGQMLRYTLRKFEPVAREIESGLGFGCREACLTVRLVQENLAAGTAAYFLPGKAPYDRQVGSRRNATRVETPPSAFLRDWVAASTYPTDRPIPVSNATVNQAVIRFLSAEPSDFALPGPSFGRWAFVRVGRGKSVLLVSSMLAETLLSALHMGLFQSLTAERQGAIGVTLGDRFEELVGDQFRRVFSPSRVRQRVRRTPNAPEADFVVGLSSGKCLVVQCRGRVLRQKGRWGDPTVFIEDLETNIVQAAEQARKFLEDNRGDPQVESVFIVLDAHFPMAGFYTGSDGRVGASTRELPLPCVLSYFDLEYIMGVLSEERLIDYLHWRGTLLEGRSLVVQDEFDAVRAFLKLRKYLPAERMVERGISLLFIGFDPRFEHDSLEAVDSELGFRFERPSAR